MSERLKSALALVNAGYRVFPAHGINDRGECTCGNKNCGSPGKHPATGKGWQSAATTSPEQVKNLWKYRPDANPAIATGKGLLVLDVDGEAGKKSLRELEMKYGELPQTRTVITGGGGIHYYFHVSKQFKNSVGSIGTGLDIRADGGYVIAPRAKHRSGNYYQWKLLCSPDDCEEAEAPPWLLTLLTAPPQAAGEKAQYQTGDRIPAGKRNQTLYTLIRQIDMFPRAGGPDQVFRDEGLICAADVKEEEAIFVIKPYIPEGQLTMIQGNPGDGKTAFACKLAALVSTGGKMLDIQCAPGPVLMLSVEDDLPVLRGRIQASGGDLKKCHFPANTAGLSFQSPEIEQYIQEIKAKLVIFDPIQAFLGAKVDMHRANETRPILAALKELAHRNQCSIVIISHLNKGLKDDAAILRSLGSIDIPGACRSVLHIGRLAGNPDKRLMVQVKSSAAKEGKSIVFSIGDHGKVNLEEYTDKGYEDLSSLGKKTRQAAESPFLANEVIGACKKVLADHPEGKKVAYNDLGITWPAAVRPKNLLDALSGKLFDEGIAIQTGERTTGGCRGVLISPVTEL